jgi:hypothetical protein
MRPIIAPGRGTANLIALSQSGIYFFDGIPLMLIKGM